MPTDYTRQRNRDDYVPQVPNWCTWVAVYGLHDDPVSKAALQTFRDEIAQLILRRPGTDFEIVTAGNKVLGLAPGAFPVLLMELGEPHSLAKHAPGLWPPEHEGEYPLAVVCSSKTGEMHSSVGEVSSERAREILQLALDVYARSIG